MGDSCDIRTVMRRIRRIFVLCALMVRVAEIFILEEPRLGAHYRFRKCAVVGDYAPLTTTPVSVDVTCLVSKFFVLLTTGNDFVSLGMGSLEQLCRICSDDLKDEGVGIFSTECMDQLVGEKIKRYLYFSVS